MSEEILRVSDYEWASVTKYIVAVSAEMALHEFDWSAIHSFPYARMGSEKLRSKKVRMLGRVMDNIDSVKEYVTIHKSNLGTAEKVVLRGMYEQLDASKKLLEDHIKRIGAFDKMMNAALEYDDIGVEVDTNEPPF